MGRGPRALITLGSPTQKHKKDGVALALLSQSNLKIHRFIKKLTFGEHINTYYEKVHYS